MQVGTSSDFSYWFNPTIGGSLGTPNGTITNTQVASAAGSGINALAFYEFGMRVDGTAGSNLTIDELRYGLSFADVTPIPEPATRALLAGSLTALMAFRRRRA